MNIRKGTNLGDLVGPLDDDEPSAATSRLEPMAKDEPANPKIVAVSIFVLPEDRRRLRQLSLDTGISVQKLGHEAMNLLLSSKGLPPLEPVSANVPSGRSRRS